MPIEAKIEQARSLFNAARIYRIVALGLFIVGLITMAILYNGISGGNFAVFFERPASLIILFVPFIPACIVNMMAAAKRKKCSKLIKDNKLDMQSVQAAKNLRQRTDLFSSKNVS